MPGKRRVSDRQWKILLAFMERHPDVANVKPVNSLLRHQLTEAWDDLTMRLNAESTGGCIKTQRQWRDYWNDKKYSVNRKRIIARQQRRAVINGNQVPGRKMIFFTESEARMVRILTPPQNDLNKVIKPKEEVITPVPEIPNMIQESEGGIVFIPFEEANGNSPSTSALLTEDVKLEMVANSPAPESSEPSSPQTSPMPSSMFTAEPATDEQTTTPRVMYRVKRQYHSSAPTVEQIRLAAEDKILAKQERRLAAKERRMAAEDRRIAAEDRRLAAEDRQLATEERKRAVHERKLAEEARRKASENKMTRALQTMSHKLTRLRADFDSRPP